MRLSNRISWKNGQLLPTFDDTITIFNRWYNPTDKTTTWYKTKLCNCFFSLSEGRRNRETTISEKSSYICRIPRSEKYLDFDEWEKLKEKSGYFTIALDDLVFLGDIQDSIDETTKGKRANDILKKYSPNCFSIKEFKDNTNKIEIARHYFLSGDVYGD